MKNVKALVLAAIMCLIISIPSYATFENDILKEGTSPLLTTVKSQLDTASDTHTIKLSEREIVAQMLDNNTISRESLNVDMERLSQKSVAELQQAGYNENQIGIIKTYEKGEDAFNHVFGSARSSEGATLEFRYRLAGSCTQKDIRIIYNMEWSDCPMWTFTDSFGVGWIAADKNSIKVETQIDSFECEIDYYTVNNQSAQMYRTVDIDDFSNCVIIGYPIMGSAGGNYGKYISGTVDLSTQSGSYNIETIQVFVAYGHTLMSLSVKWDAQLDFDISRSSISFGPSLDVTQTMMTQDHHTFKYSDRDTITA